MSAFDGLVSKTLEKTDWTKRVPYWQEFQNDFDRFFRIPGRDLPSKHKPEVIFAGFFQIERAFMHIFQEIIGGSMPVAGLRAAVWESIFTHDMRRYNQILHGRMSDYPSLIVGPSGSGKELVARAIALSGYIPFDPKTGCFKAGQAELYVPLNLAALTPTLIESELFGHAENSFNGATERKGWLEKCGEYGAVFLDEIGELDGAIQVKLLRVLERRRVPKGRRHGDASLQREDHRRDEPRPRGRDARRPVPPRPVLSPLRRSARSALTRRATGRSARRPGRSGPLRCPRSPLREIEERDRASRRSHGVGWADRGGRVSDRGSG